MKYIQFYGFNWCFAMELHANNIKIGVTIQLKKTAKVLDRVFA
jgi:hypothetical protein